MSTIDREWLKSLKVGDEVILTHHHFGTRTRQIAKVDRETKMYLVVGNQRFRKEDGREPGRSMGSWATIGPATSETRQRTRDENRKALLCDRLRCLKWSALPLETLESIVALLPEKE